MRFQKNFFSVLLRGCIVLAVFLGALAQPSVAGAEADAPPPLAPVLVKDINPNNGSFPGDSSFPGEFVSLNNKLFFTANDGVHGLQLWQSDGTIAGTQMLATPGIVPQELKVIGNLLYFVSKSGTTTNQLWRTDGTLTGTVRLSDNGTYVGGVLCVAKLAACFSTPAEITDAGGYALFIGRDAAHGSVLWRSDGTPAGTVRVKDVYPANLTLVGNSVYFQSIGTLWKSDGTPDGTQPIATPGILLSLVAVGSTVFFIRSIDGQSAHGGTLWMSDGTVTGTIQVQLPVSVTGSSILRIAGLSDRVVFLTTDGRLWETDGTVAGTQQLGAFDEPYFFNYVWSVVGNRVFFDQHYLYSDQTVLFASDGTPAGTQQLIRDFVVDNLRYIASKGGAFTVVIGNDLWVTDGTTTGTFKAVQLHPANYFYQNRGVNCLLIGDTLYFETPDNAIGGELWSLTFNDQPDVRLSVPERLFTKPINPAPVIVDITNFGAGTAQSVTLTATLGLSLTYVSDTSGITPMVQGNTLVWSLPNLNALDRKAFYLSVGLPNSVIGLRYPISFTLITSTSAGEDKTVEIVAAKVLQLPLVFR